MNTKFPIYQGPLYRCICETMFISMDYLTKHQNKCENLKIMSLLKQKLRLNKKSKIKNELDKEKNESIGRNENQENKIQDNEILLHEEEETNSCYGIKLQNVYGFDQLASEQNSTQVYLKEQPTRNETNQTINESGYEQFRKRNPYFCNECYTSYEKFFYYKNHMLTQHSGKSSLCPLCTKMIDSNDLETHFKMEHKKNKFKCEICAKYFTKNYHLKRHFLTHTGEKPYKCPFCPAQFRRKDGLNRHLMGQHGLDPFPSSISLPEPTLVPKPLPEPLLAPILLSELPPLAPISKTLPALIPLPILAKPRKRGRPRKGSQEIKDEFSLDPDWTEISKMPKKKRRPRKETLKSYHELTATLNPNMNEIYNITNRSEPCLETDGPSTPNLIEMCEKGQSSLETQTSSDEFTTTAISLNPDLIDILKIQSEMDPSRLEKEENQEQSITITTTLDPNLIEIFKMPKKRGRPRKRWPPFNPIKKEINLENICETTRKKRGRPRKIDTIQKEQLLDNNKKEELLVNNKIEEQLLNNKKEDQQLVNNKKEELVCDDKKELLVDNKIEEQQLNDDKKVDQLTNNKIEGQQLDDNKKEDQQLVNNKTEQQFVDIIKEHQQFVDIIKHQQQKQFVDDSTAVQYLCKPIMLPKKGPGRPRKPKIPKDPMEPPKKRGRPRKIFPQTHNNNRIINQNPIKEEEDKEKNSPIINLELPNISLNQTYKNDAMHPMNIEIQTTGGLLPYKKVNQELDNDSHFVLDLSINKNQTNSIEIYKKSNQISKELIEKLPM